jgi:hypothetical protein
LPTCPATGFSRKAAFIGVEDASAVQGGALRLNLFQGGQAFLPLFIF